MKLQRWDAQKVAKVAKKIKPYVYIAPAVIPLLVFVYYPLLHSLTISFFNWNMVSPNKQWVGWDNYKTLVSSDEFWTAVQNTGLYIVLLLALLLVAPFFVAFAVTRVRGKWQAFYKGAIFTPTVVSLAVASIAFLWLFNPLIGIVNELLEWIGLPKVNWLTDPEWALGSVAIITAWKTFGYHFIVLLAGLLAVPQDVIEMSRVEGLKRASGLLRNIYVPLSGGTLLYVFVITVVFGIQHALVPIQMLTNGGPNQASSHIVFLVYQYAFQFFQSGLASAVAVVTFLLFLLLILLQAFVIDRRIYYEN